MSYKSKAGWYVQTVKGKSYNPCGPFATLKLAKEHGYSHTIAKECLIWYGTPKRINASKEVYSRTAGGVYFKRVVQIIA